MRKLGWILAVLALCLADAAFSAVMTTVNGTVQAQRGSAPPRTLRQGDEVVQGDTVSTGPASSAVIKFEDGQVAGLSANSRMTITAYQYNPEARTGNVLLSLVTGGMRAVTGLIGRITPDRVNYRAATATIGIRGTDVTLLTAQGNAIAMVTEGVIAFTFSGRTVTVPAGEGVNARTDGTFQQAAIQTILGQFTPQEQELFGGLQTLSIAISQAAAGFGGIIDRTIPSVITPGGGVNPIVPASPS